MSDYNFGSDGAWRFIFFCAALGAVSLGVLIVKAIVWAIQHVRFV